MKKILLLTFFILFIPVSFASNLKTPKIEKIYNKFSYKLEKKYSIDKQIEYLENLNLRLNKYFLRKTLKENQKNLIKDILALDNERIFTLKLRKLKDNKKQKIKEKLYLNKFKENLISGSIPEFINILLGNRIKLLIVNKNYEFIQNNKIKKIHFSKYYNLSSSNYKSFSNKNGYILNKAGTNIFWFVDNFSFEEKIMYSELGNYFRFNFDDYTNFFIENNNYYTYNFDDYNFLNDSYGVYKSDLEKLFGNLQNILLYKTKKGKYVFIREFKKIKLINTDIIFGITDKIKFLEYIKYDKKTLTEDTDLLFKNLKKETEKITYNKNKSEKIKIIYAWILKNITYPKNFILSDKKIFSGILTYKNKIGVCDGYAKLTSYMLLFSGVSNSNIIRGQVIDAEDFPKIGHAWIKIGKNYYDPTFDDPIGTESVKKFSDYKYYNLPYDLIYTNRYTYERMPESLKYTTEEFRKDLISKNLSNLVSKYINKDYILLKPYKFKEKYSIAYNEKITIEKLKKIVQYGEVNNFIFKDKIIKKLNYYKIENDNLETILSQIDYNLENIYLFKWSLENGLYEYRIAYNVKF